MSTCDSHLQTQLNHIDIWSAAEWSNERSISLSTGERYLLLVSYEFLSHITQMIYSLSTAIRQTNKNRSERQEDDPYLGWVLSAPDDLYLQQFTDIYLSLVAQPVLLFWQLDKFIRHCHPPLLGPRSTTDGPNEPHLIIKVTLREHNIAEENKTSPVLCSEFSNNNHFTSVRLFRNLFNFIIIYGPRWGAP